VSDVLDALWRADSCHDDPDDGGTVSLLDHGLQCAAILAEVYPDDVELHVAGLVHDLGLVIDPGDHAEHARHGAHFVGIVLGSRVAEIVRLHTDGLRYLLTAAPAYGERLGRESRRSLDLAGGPLNPTELGRFLGSRYWRDAIALRRSDELARTPRLVIGSVERWEPALREVAGRAGETGRRAS
jgi:predicted HD phosphohydrolase